MSKPGSISAQPAFSSWWKHLRPEGKRDAAKRDRKDAKLSLPSKLAET